LTSTQVAENFFNLLYAVVFGLSVLVLLLVFFYIFYGRELPAVEKKEEKKEKVKK
jgi:ABC-type transport system involved in cytochrome bd biosynthesis fused ATPase/permease subunit